MSLRPYQQRRIARQARRGVPYHGKPGRPRVSVFVGAMDNAPASQYDNPDDLHPFDHWLKHIGDMEPWQEEQRMRDPGPWSHTGEHFPFQRDAFQRNFLANFLTRARRWAARARVRAAHRLNLVLYGVVTDARALILGTRGQII